METIHPSTSRPRILIADDHAIFTEALRAYLEKRFTVVGVAADGRAMLQEAIRLRPDVIVADVAMPLLNGLDAARRIREQSRRPG
jgi:DNA-binding NarL/FixJ family response regulator